MTPTKLDHGLRAVGVVWYRETDWPRLRALLADVLARLPDHPAKRIGDLLPWNWEAKARPVRTSA